MENLNNGINWDLAPEGAVGIKLKARAKMYLSNIGGFYFSWLEYFKERK